jgi:lysyl endopeptidase
MKKSLLVFTMLTGLICHLTYSQISQGGTPQSFNDLINDRISSQVPVVLIPDTDVDILRAEDEVLDQYKNIPWRFGYNHDVSLNRETHGLEETLDDGSLLWRISINSDGALSLNFLFDNFKIPDGASLFIFNEDKTEILGAFTSYNNQDDKLFATTLISGDYVTIEYYEPWWVSFRGTFELVRVTHGYRGPHDFMKGFGASGYCNVNVMCPESAGMENQIRSVCMLVSGSNGFCTGALINNTENNGKPYVLSADHCYYNPGAVVYWFNWQSPTCTNPSTSPPYNSMSGATQRARYSTSDMWLVELNQPIPSEYNVYYSGWNRTDTNYIVGKIWGIHHPNGDIKKISWAETGVSTTTYLQNSVPGNGSHWRITQWSDGTTTEPGSSGSPLFDPQGRIIGQLHGGYASCSSMTSDWYGKLSVSWTGGNTNSTRLSNWLDPIETQAESIEGYDPTASIGVFNSFSTDDLIIYPNPNDGFFSISFSENIQFPIQLTLSDIQGRLVFSRFYETVGETVNVDVRGFSKGIYIIDACSSEKKIVKKMIIE